MHLHCSFHSRIVVFVVCGDRVHVLFSMQSESPSLSWEFVCVSRVVLRACDWPRQVVS